MVKIIRKLVSVSSAVEIDVLTTKLETSVHTSRVYVHKSCMKAIRSIVEGDRYVEIILSLQLTYVLAYMYLREALKLTYCLNI